MTGANVTKRQNALSIWAVARTSCATFILSGALLAPTPSLAQQLPTGGAVTHGTATIGAPAGGTLNINQSSNRAVIDWSSFSIGAGGTVNFNQPGVSAATLNRVTGATPSSIAGAINAPGTVLLVNPNGIAITPTGVVNTGSFAASTLDIKNSDFLAGNYKFSGNGASATVTNAGRINVSDGGFAALLGGRVANDGIISARLGKVGLGSGEMITLDLAGDGFLSVAVPSEQLGNLRDGTGQALVTNRGKIRADGGIVHLSAATANTILRDAVNVPGSIRANSVGTRSGRIILGGGDGGRVTVSGRVSASGTRVARGQSVAGPGGRIDVTGNEIALNGARLNASGATGGGRIRIGGDYQGSGDLQRAQRVAIDSASIIRADAVISGNGGTIIVWSDGVTSVSGAFSARGGANSGNGGLVETSGHELSFAGARVDASAPRGRTGEWLLDPVSLTVNSAAAATISANLATANVTLLTTASSASGPGQQWSGAGDIFVEAPIYWTSGSTLRFNAYNSIFINASIVGGTGSTLWLNTGASGSVTQTAPISVTNLVLPLNFGSVALTNTGNAVATLRTDDSTIDWESDTNVINPGSVAFTNNGNLTTGLLYARNLTLNIGGSLTATSVMNSGMFSGGTVTSILASGDITFLPGTALGGANVNVRAGGSISFSGLTTSGKASIRANGTIQFAENVYAFEDRPITSMTIRSDSGLVTFAPTKLIFTANPVEIFYNPLVATGSYANTTSYSGLTTGVGNGSVTAYMLVNNYGQLQQVYTNRAGVYALGYDIDASASATCNCRGFDPIGYSGTNAGAFTGVFDGRGHVITNLTQRRDGSSNGDLGPVGLFYNNQGTIRNLGIIGGTLLGSNNFGGAIASQNSGTISNSYSTATITGFLGSSRIGGLVGLNTGLINGGSYATGTVTGYHVGGLVGENRGTINDSYAAGTVSGNYAGGLVGLNSGNVRWTYSLSTVAGTSYTGGLVGVNQYFDTGGWGSVRDSYVAGRLSGAYVGGLVGNNQFRDNDTMESFNQQHSMSARVWHSYWDSAVAGTTRAFGRSYHDMPGGWSSEQIMYIDYLRGSAFAAGSYEYFRDQVYIDPRWGNQQDPAQRHGWDDARFNDHWYIVEGETRPFLRAEYSTNIQNLHQLQLIDMNGAASYRLARNIDATQELASGMWKDGAFSPIRPVSWTDRSLPIYANMGPGFPTIQVGHLYVPETTGVSSFTGSFDGQGHTISNLYVDRTVGITNPYATGSGYHAGLFDAIGSGGSVRDLGIINGKFFASTGYAGSIAGGVAPGGTIERSYARSTGSSNSVVSDGVGGGLVGWNEGLISQSYASVNVYGVGQSSSDWQFYASLGGLAGNNGGTIENSYATGRVQGNGVIGGLVGTNWATIRNTYAAVELGKAYSGYGIRIAGQLVGLQHSGSTQNSYYDSSIALPWDIATLGTLGTGLTTAQMQDINTFRTVYQGWDFRNVWVPPNQVGQVGQSVARYPEFYWANHVAVIENGSATRVYGDANPALLASIYGLRSYDTPRAVPVTVSTSATTSSNVGTYQTSANLTVLPATLQGCGPCTPTHYNTPGLTLNGVTIYFSRTATLQDVVNTFNAQTWRTGVTAAVREGGGFVLTSPNTFSYVGLNTTVGDAAAWLGLPSVFATLTTVHPQQLSAVSTDGAAYRLINLPGTLSITPRTVDVTANGGSSTYGQSPTNPGLTITGLVNGDTLTGLSNSFGITGTTNAGSYTLSVNGLVSSNPNYQVVRHSGTWTVDPALLTVTANGGSSVYGQSPTNPGLTVTGLRNGDTLSGLSNAFGITGLTNVGSHALGVIGTFNNPNYQLTRQSGTWTVTPAELIVTANGGSSIYGQSPTNPGLTVTGLQNNDTLTGLSNSFGITNLSNADSYTLSVAGTFNNANYSVVRHTGTWTVNPADVVVTANGGSSIYGQSQANPGLSATGLQNGQSVAVLTGLSNSFGITSMTDAGDHTLSVVGTLTNNNYRVTRHDGTWTVNPADVVVTANGGSSIYGQSPTNPGFSATGLQNGQSVAVLTGLSNSFGITNATDAGDHTLSVVGTLTNGNYRVTRHDGTWTVNPADVVVTANGGSSIYGQSPTNPGFSATGLQNGQGVDVLTGLSNSFGITNMTGAGSHTLGVVGTLANGNYRVTRIDGTWLVNPAELVVTANGGNSVYGQSPVNPGLTVIGLQNGDVLTGLSNAFGITGATNVGVYTLGVVGTFSNPNYVVSRGTGMWTVDRAPITVSANPQSRMFSEADPLLTYRISSGQLFNGEQFSGALVRDSGTAPGFYAITQGSLAATANYALTFVGSTFEIRALPSDSPSRFVSISPPPPAGTTSTSISFDFAPPPPVTFGPASNPGPAAPAGNPAPNNPAPRGNTPPAENDPSTTGSIGGAANTAGANAGDDEERRRRARAGGVN
jgi:filamentous hemagglutinin family protein